MHINGTMVIGVGGVGTALIQPLAALLANDPDCQRWEGDKPLKPRVTIVDGDVYEDKNLRNQCITPADVGMNKAEWACTLISGLVEAEAWSEYIEGTSAIESWLVSRRSDQERRSSAGSQPGVALIIIPVDNDHCRNWVYNAIEAVPRTNVLVIDPSNGAGDDADEVDVVTYLRVWDTDMEAVVEAWPSPLLKFEQLAKPTGRNPKAGCHEKAESQPQLRTSNMRAALYCYDAVERFLKERGMPEGYRYDDEHGERVVGSRLPTAADMETITEVVDA